MSRAPRPMAAVLLALAIWSAPAYAGDTRIGSWYVTNETDIATNKPAPRLFAPAPGGDLLSFLCDSQGPIINLETQRLEFAVDDFPAVILRIDDAPAHVAIFGAGPKHLIGARLSRVSYAAVSTATRLRLRIVQRSGAAYNADFRLAKTTEAFKALLAVCPLSSAPDSSPKVYDPAQDVFAQLPEPARTPDPGEQGAQP